MYNKIVIHNEGVINLNRITPCAIDLLHDGEKARDFFALTKEKFLQSYSYLTEADYDLTVKKYSWLIDDVIND